MMTKDQFEELCRARVLEDTLAMLAAYFQPDPLKPLTDWGEKRKVVGEFQSERELFTTYRVMEDSSGELSCTCPGYRYRKRCWHVEKVKKH